MNSWSRDVISWLALGVPLTLGLGAALVPAQFPLRWAARITGVTAALVLVVLLGAVGASTLLSSSFVRIDVVGGTMLALVALLGVVVSRYSATYLVGEPGLRRFARALLVTLGAVTALVLANNLAVMTVAWTTTSLALHRLLAFYPDRRAALVAAHKKFILSRLADGCLLVALTLIGREVGTLQLDRLSQALASVPVLPPTLGAAAVLVVVAVALKSAQLPFHGWLTQVMEAPTPVSALLHAGVVNLGGFFLIRLAPLLERAAVAMALVFAIGLITALLAGLVMMTRVSVKLSLAWSTCAQLGFMLMQCGLGAWDLALLHLVAHSLYKAHAFLSAGGTVEAWRVRSQAPAQPAGLAAPLATVGVIAAVATAGLHFFHAGAIVPLALSQALTVVPALGVTRRARVLALGWLGVIVALALTWHALASAFVPSAAAAPNRTLLSCIATAGLLLLAGVQVLLRARPDGAVSRALQPRLFAGFYLDEYFTRFTFRLWPPRLPGRACAQALLPQLEAR